MATLMRRLGRRVVRSVVRAAEVASRQWPAASDGAVRVWHVIDTLRERTGATSLAIIVTPTTAPEVPGRAELSRFAALHVFRYASERQRREVPSARRLPTLGELAARPEVRDVVADIVFVDPWHTYEDSSQLLSLGASMVRPGGHLVVHDCLPDDAASMTPSPVDLVCWSGETWRAFADLVHSIAAPVTWTIVDTDTGVGVVRFPERPGNVAIVPTVQPRADVESLLWLAEHREDLHVRSFEEWRRTVG